MIVVDSSVWVDYFNGRATPETDTLDSLLGEKQIVIGDLILVEVLQGFLSERDFREARRLLRTLPIVAMLGPTMAEQSASNYRKLRRLGVNVRKTIDVMIGTSCIARALPLLYSDRDFDPMVQYLGLRPAAGSL